MNKKFFYNFIFKLFMVLVFSLQFVSCNDNENDISEKEEIIGSWYGTRAYYNPASGTKYQYLTLLLEDNGTGELEYESPSGFSFVKFRYKVSKDKINCKGVKASTDDFEAEDFEMTLSIEGNRLIPLDRYSYFILTKDNSVITDGDGNEVINDRELFNQVWIRDDGYSICVINNDKCTEYMLLNQYGNIYSQKSVYNFSYDNIRRRVIVGTTEYEVIRLTTSILEIMNNSSHFVFNAGTSKDIPTNGENSGESDMLKILTSKPFGWMTKDHVMMNFISDGRTLYMEQSSKTLGSIGYISLRADGEYSLKDKKITCKYTEVEWEQGKDLTKNWFPGWSYGNPRTRIYTIKYISIDSIILEADDGKKYKLEPV